MNDKARPADTNDTAPPSVAADPSFAYSDRFDRALVLAARAHRNQLRKGGDIPYVQHPVHVAILLVRHGFDEDVAIAGLLHDVVEDCDVSLESIASEFGPRVARLVDGVTEVKEDARVSGAMPTPRPWRTRKEEALARLGAMDRDGAALKAADALHNAHSTLRELATSGPVAWARFNAAPAEQCWYYGAVADGVASKLGDHPLARELRAAVARLIANDAHG